MRGGNGEKEKKEGRRKKRKEEKGEKRTLRIFSANWYSFTSPLTLVRRLGVTGAVRGRGAEGA